MANARRRDGYWWVKLKKHPEIALVRFLEGEVRINLIGQAESLNLATDKTDAILVEYVIPVGGRERILKFLKTTRKAHSTLKKIIKQLRKSFGSMRSAHKAYQSLIDQALDLTK